MSYAEHGWEIIADVYLPDDCAALIEAAGDAERLTHPHRVNPAFMNAMRAGADLARHHLGPDPRRVRGTNLRSTGLGAAVSNGQAR